MASVLVIDDERALLDTLGMILTRSGYQVLMASDGESGLSLARRESPDMIILDLILPKMNGLGVCRVLRKESSVPILILSGMGDEEDKVAGLELGADDYLTKPFGIRELLARVRALLRRTEANRASSEVASSSDSELVARCLREGDLEVDLVASRVTHAGRTLKLKPKEFDLLVFLMHNRGQPFSQEQLLREVWGYEDASDTRTVVVHVRRLRERLELDPSHPRLIETVRGLGYRFRE